MASISVKVTVTQNVFQSDRFVEAIEKKLREKTGPEIKKLFMGTVETWEHKPTFPSTRIHTGNTLGISVRAAGPDKKQYQIVSHGSPAHTINARRGGVLRFASTYHSASLPRILTSRQARRGGVFIAKHSVNHPGFEAREFDTTIAEFYRTTFQEDMQETMREASMLKFLT